MYDIEIEVMEPTPEEAEMCDNNLTPFAPPVEEATIDDAGLFTEEKWNKVRFYLLLAKGVRIDKIDYIIAHADEICHELRTFGLLDDELERDFWNLLGIVVNYVESIEPNRVIEFDIHND